MACVGAGLIGGSGSSWNLLKDNKARRKKMVNDKRGMVSCVASSSSVMDPYRTLKIQPGASESEVRKAFRQLALKVCIFFLSKSDI